MPQQTQNLTTSTDIVSGATYNAMGELLTMTGVNGAPSETRSYNSIGQMTALTSRVDATHLRLLQLQQQRRVRPGQRRDRLLTAQTDYLPVSRLTADH